MAYLSTVFPELISFGASGGPGYSTDLVETDGGQEQRNQNWSQARLRWEVSHAARIAGKEAELLAFFRQARGRLHSFGFKDWTDFKANDNAGIGIFLVIDATHFQCAKRYGSGAQLEDRKITRPKSTISVTGGSVSSVDYTTGIVTMSSGTPTNWSGEFYVPCRFDVDQMKRDIIDKVGQNLAVGWHDVPIVEVRE